jgi:hypothetical protein
MTMKLFVEYIVSSHIRAPLMQRKSGHMKEVVFGEMDKVI